ncbi:MAG: hypothetical protein Tsb0014_18570 [Pleurocapsa sp.]
MLVERYQILRELGQGGFGKTYLAKDILLPDKQHCVVKQFEPPVNLPQEAFEQARRSFEREAIVLNDIGREHPQIPRLLAYFENNGQFFLVQEYIEGHDLSKEIEAGKPLPETEVIKLLDEVLGILEFVHQRNIIHRDIKPSNIMRRDKDGKLFLIDFGTVKQQIPTEMVTVAGEVKSQFAFGSEGYTPYEQLKLNPKLASDIYALGMMAIFALTGIPPNQIPEDRETGQFKWRDRIYTNSLQFLKLVYK